MSIYQDANDKWIFFDGATKHHFDTEREARRAMAIAEQKTGEQEIIEQANALIPVLRDAFMRLQALHNLWVVEDVSGTILKHQETGEDIADHPLAYWQALGTVFTGLLKFMETPLDPIKQTPNQVLTRRNWRK
jgi:hypothetical protein